MNKLPLIAALLAGACAGAQAQDWSVKLGATLYQPHSKTSGIKGIGIPAGADADVGDAATAIFVVERRLGPNLGAELVLGIPPRVKAKATGTVAFLGDDVLSAKNVAPTLILNYYFGDESSALRPYVGMGINYTRFASVRSKLAPDVKMSDSVGPMAQVGVNYAFSKQMGLFASIARVDVHSDVVAVASTVLTTSINFRPWTYSSGLWMRF